MQQASTFIKGMNQDSSFLKTDNTSCYALRNFKLITDEGGSTGALVNEKGMKLDFCFPSLGATYQVTDIDAFIGTVLLINGNTHIISGTDTESVYNDLISAYSTEISLGLVNFYYTTSNLVIIPFDPTVTISSTDITSFTEMTPAMTELYIVGWTHLNDNIIVLTTANDGNGQIWEISYDEVTNTVDVDSNGCVKPKNALRYNGCINLSTEHAVTKIEGHYETQKISRIYWTDNNEPVKSFNLNDKHGFAINCLSFDLTPQIVFSQPVITGILSGGNIPYGSSIQMGYRLKNGTNITPVSPLTPLLPLYEKDEADEYKDIKGSQSNALNTKAISFQIDNLDTNYSTIEYVFVIYTTLDVPSVVSFSETIPSTGSVLGNFTNSESNLVTLTPQDINLDISEFNIAKDITIKSNRLIAANLRLSEFDIPLSEFDARAYRYKPSGTATIFQSNGSSTVIPSDFTVDEEHDAINPFNNPLDSNFSAYDDQKYQQDGVTLGGTGKYISYKFITRTLSGDTRGKAGQLPWTGLSSTSDISYTPGGNTVTYNINDQYNNFTSPFNQQLFVGYQREEVYRFAIVFYSKKGKRSFAKWIGDIKFPTCCEELITNTDVSLSDKEIKVKPLGIEFTITIPQQLSNKIQGYEIVRVKRGVHDRTRWGGGIAMPIWEDGNDIKVPGTWLGVPEHNFVAPRIIRTAFPFALFRDVTGFVQQSEDYIKLVYAYPTDSTSGEAWESHWYGFWVSSAGAQLSYNKLYNPVCYPEDTINTIKGFRNVQHDGVLGLQEIDSSITFGDFINRTYSVDEKCADCQILVLDSTFQIQEFSNGTSGSYLNLNDGYEQVPYLLYCRNLAKQYGGNTYEARSSNIYMSTGMVTFTDSDDTIIVFGGDTYINYYMHETVSNVGAAAYTDKNSSAIAFPCESPFNADLRRGNFFQKDRGEPTGTNDTSDPYVSYDIPQYVHTDIYEQPNNIKLYIDKNYESSFNTEFPYTIWASEIKTNGELTDNWGVFLDNNRVDVDGIYGEITSIHNFKDKLIFYQQRAFGALAINERSVITDANGIDLVLGKGDVVGQYVYISKHTGCSHRTGVVQSENNIYHFDVRQKKLWQYGINSKLPLSDVKGMSSFFNNFVYGTELETTDNPTNLNNVINIHGAYEHRYNRVLFTFLTTKKQETISFNELLNSFESFYDFFPKMYLSTGRKLLSIERNESNKVYQHDKGDYCKYYDNSPSPSILDIVINGGSPINKVWGTVQWLSELTDVNTNNEIQATYEKLSVFNEHQNTGEITLTEPDNIKRRFRTWRHSIQRDINTPGSEPRIRNPWIRIKLEKDNTLNYRFVAHDLLTSFGISTITKLDVQK